MSASHLADYSPSGYWYGYPYWDSSVAQAEQRNNYYDGWYLRGLVKTLEYPTWFGVRYMRKADLQCLEGC